MAANAADLKPYVEASAGYARQGSIDFENLLDGTHEQHDGTIITRGSIKNDAQSTWNAGVEIGLRDIFFPNLRLALSDTYLHPKRHLSGSVNGSSVDVDEGHSSVNVIMVNAYYDFKIDSVITPFVGIGLGAYKNNGMPDAEFTWSLMAGGKYHINENFYVGAKASYYHFNGGSLGADSGTLQSADANAYTLNANIGYEF